MGCLIEDKPCAAPFGRRPQLLCGVLFHAANRTFTFHGDALAAGSNLLPVFQSWIVENVSELPLPSLQEPPLDSASLPDPDAVSSPCRSDAGSGVACCPRERPHHSTNDATFQGTPAVDVATNLHMPLPEGDSHGVMSHVLRQGGGSWSVCSLRERNLVACGQKLRKLMKRVT